MNEIKFMISDTQYIRINPEECMHDDQCQFCTSVDVDYVDEVNNIDIRFGYEVLQSMCYFVLKTEVFTELMLGTRTLDEDIDLGFTLNQAYARVMRDGDWFKYLWMDNAHKHIKPYFSSWLYNDKKGNIILEISPMYPWRNDTKKTCPEKLSYKEWVKTYKPAITTIIPRKNIEVWRMQFQALVKKYDLFV